GAVGVNMGLYCTRFFNVVKKYQKP
ncbi:hypothetical protein D030_5401B, partial [Vibrio parahaemolyticus AQ3810]